MTRDKRRRGGNRHPTRKRKAETGWGDAHDHLADKLGDAAAGECAEDELGGWYVAHNPHDEPTESTRGQRLDPGEIYAEHTDGRSCLFEDDGGTTIDGGAEGNLAAELEALE